jgi:lysophospholipase L1-like esterase
MAVGGCPVQPCGSSEKRSFISFSNSFAATGSVSPLRTHSSTSAFRLDALLSQNSYDAVLVGIGGNDTLRGVALASTKENVAEIVHKALAHTPYVALIATPTPEPLRAAVGSRSDASFYEEISKAK